MGFLGHSLIGPLLLFYFLRPEERFFVPKNLVHTIYPILGAIIILFFSDAFETVYLFERLYLLSNVGLGIYTFYIFLQIKKRAIEKSKIDASLFGVIVALLLIFFIQALAYSLTIYTIGTGLATVALYFLFYQMLKNPKKLIRNINGSILKEEQRNKVISYLEEHKIYKESFINLSSFSTKTAIPKYIISRVVAEKYKTSFPEVINRLRINEIIESLKDPDSLDEKIENLADDVGFNTISNFYAAFKKETNMSPREYQRCYLVGKSTNRV